MMERLLDITVWYIYTFSSFSLSQFFLISRVIIEILAIELDLIIMNFTKGQEFYREISRQTKQNRSARNCLAWNKRVVAQVKNTRRGEGKTGAFPIRGPDTGTPFCMHVCVTRWAPSSSKADVPLCYFPSRGKVGNASLLTRQDVDPNYVCTRIVSPEYTCVRRHPRISGSKSSSEHEYSSVLFLSTRKRSLKSFRPFNFQMFRANILYAVQALFY